MTRSRFAAVVAAAALVLAGCGGSDEPTPTKPKVAESKKPDLSNLSAKKLLDKAKAAVKSEASISMKGDTKAEGSTMSVDMHYSDEDAWGTLSYDGAELRVLRLDETFVKVNDSFWRSIGAPDATITSVDGRWMNATGDSGFEQFLGFAERSFLADEVLKPENKMTKGEPKTVEGVESLALVDGDDGTLYVAADDGRPIQIDFAGNGGFVTFSYEDQETPKAPPASDVVKAPSLAG